MARRQKADPDPRLEALRVEPPVRFVAARDALVRELAAAGDARAAAAVRAMRRPTRRIWLLNRVARERRAEIEALLQAGARVRQAHAAALQGRRDAGLRAADESLSAALDAVVEAARALAQGAGLPPDHAVLVRLREDLRVLATGSAADGERLRSGSIERPPASGGEASGWGLIPATPIPAREAGPRPERTDGRRERKAPARKVGRKGTAANRRRRHR